MRFPRQRFMVAAAAAATLVSLAACSPESGDEAATSDDAAATSRPGDDAAATSAAPNGDLADIGVDKDGDTPTLTWDDEPFADGDLPFVAAQTELFELTAGDGDEVADTHEVQMRYLTVNGANGEELVSTFTDDATVTMDLTDETLFPAFREQLPGRMVGDELLMAIPAADAFGELGSPQLGVGPTDTLLFYLEITGTGEPLTQAEGEEVEPKEGLPLVEADGTTPAQIDVEGVEAPDQLVVQPLIKGEGPEVVAGQTVKVHYTGVKLSDGEMFDSSLMEGRGEPFEFQVGSGQVITGWDEGIVGQTVGSRVLLVIPPDMAYGASEGHELQEETLVFVVDILGAS